MSKYVTIETSEAQVTYRLATFGERIGARIIDVIIISIPSAIIPLLPAWLYWAFMQSGERQATFGQRALGIMVIDKNGRKVNFGQATGRFFGNFLNVITLLVGYFMFFFNDKRQCLHDYVSGCMVVRDFEVERNQDIMQHLID